ncbi:hypothetical protein [uncultured Sphingomonas sp.]|uniref:hypothetical protein n=1 Tax=uncultured Sphingomonas sp. TaxID=158754 RepID=UPI003747A116
MSDLDEFERLATLRRAGVITDAEFDIEKVKMGIGGPDDGSLANAEVRRWPIVVKTAILTVVAVFALLFFTADPAPVEGNSSVEASLPDASTMGQVKEGTRATLPQAEAAQPADNQRDDELIRQAADAWGDVRQSDDGSEAAYKRHTMLLEQLRGRGICWGKEDQVQADYEFHRCGPDSI